MSRAEPRLRCAIYTRKSSEEGLEQGFNSLHAQRAACEAYVLSQAGEGWQALATEYDDGGISGGTMDRPGLKALLADIERNKVDIVVVYKVDRLTRSLTDFAKIIEAFDRNGVSFVSVTQAFNTTNSMGRLTLNVLLSFAQFEREVTGERIRDKIAASKARGMWMGGMPPLGYDIPTDQTTRALVVNPAEAEVVQDIYRRYLRLKSVNALRDELDRKGIRSKRWTSRKGRAMGGKAFATGSLFHLLQCRVYLGEIVHRGNRSIGAHPAIVTPEIFDAVQAQFAANTHARRDQRIKSALPLTGRIFDAEGRRMSGAFSYGRNGNRHTYYISKSAQEARASGLGVIDRVAAKPLEEAILERLRKLTSLPNATLAEQLSNVTSVTIAQESISLALSTQVCGDRHPQKALSRLTSKVFEGDDLAIVDGSLLLTINVRPVFRGGRTWIVRTDARSARANNGPDPELIASLAEAHTRLLANHASPMTPEAWPEASAFAGTYYRRHAELAFLAPSLQRAILEGDHPVGLTGRQLMHSDLPLAWADQRKHFINSL